MLTIVQISRIRNSGIGCALVAICSLLVTPLVADQLMEQDNWRFKDEVGRSLYGEFWDVAVRNGKIYLATTKTEGKVKIFTVSNFSDFQEIDETDGQYGELRGLVVDSLGNIYVLDAEADQVLKYDPDGNEVARLPQKNDSEHPFQIEGFHEGGGTSYLAISPDDTLFVADAGNGLIHKLSTQGEILKSFGSTGELTGQFNGKLMGVTAITSDEVFSISQKGAGAGRSLIKFNDAGTGRDVARGSQFLNGQYEINSTPDGLIWAISSQVTRIWTRDSEAMLWEGVIEPVPRGFLGGIYPSFTVGDDGNRYLILNKAGHPQNGLHIYTRTFSEDTPVAPTAIPSPLVVDVEQQERTTILRIRYRVTDPDSETVTTALLGIVIPQQGNANENDFTYAIPIRNLEGDHTGRLGLQVPTNVQHTVLWDVAKDWTDVESGTLKIEVMAKDERELHPFHWIEVPERDGLPGFMMSRSAIETQDLMPVIRWSVAIGDPKVVLQDGKVLGTNQSNFDGQTLVDRITLTNAGRAFVLEELKVSVPNLDQIERANSGNFGFVGGVTENFVVRN